MGKETFKTKVKKKTLSPTWEEEFVFGAAPGVKEGRKKKGKRQAAIEEQGFLLSLTVWDKVSRHDT